MVILVVIPRQHPPRAGRAAAVAGAVDHAVLDGGGPDDGDVLGTAGRGVVDAAEAAEGVWRVGHFEDGVVGGGADGGLVRGGGCFGSGGEG